MARSPKGGTVGINGEFYKGGTFLPSTQLPKQGPSSRKKGSGKEEIEPYVWEVAPSEGVRSIYRSISVLVDMATGTVNEAAANYYDRDVDELKALWQRYQNGERWYTV